MSFGKGELKVEEGLKILDSITNFPAINVDLTLDPLIPVGTNTMFLAGFKSYISLNFSALYSLMESSANQHGSA